MVKTIQTVFTILTCESMIYLNLLKLYNNGDFQVTSWTHLGEMGW